MTSAAVLRELEAHAEVRGPEPGQLEGVKLAATLVPPDADALAATLAACAARSLPLLVRGGGTHQGIGNRPGPAAAWLSTERLGGCEVEADEGVAWAGAGTKLAALASAAEEAGWRSPLAPLVHGGTVGGALAAAVSGPRALGLGPPRRTALGLDVALASGERTRCGSRVVKNVSGYDLAKLYVGSFGTLGVITGAWLRLRPRPAAEIVLAAPAGAETWEQTVALARGPGARAVARVDAELAGRVVPGAEGDLLLVELAGDAPVVEPAAEALRREAGAAEAPGDAVERLGALEHDAGVAPLRFRLSAPPSAMPRLRDRLREAGAHTVLHPGLASVVAFFGLARPDGALVDEAWRAVQAARPEGGAACTLEQAPAWAKEGRDVFAAHPETLGLMRALKQQFDPAGILNPGRFAGGI